MTNGEFSKGRWAGGCLVAFGVGCLLNMWALAVTLKINVTVISAIGCALPGVIMMIVAKRAERRDFGNGMLIGACFMAIGGGICGAIATATQVGH